MVLDSRVKIPDSLHTSLRTAIKQALTLESWVSESRERVASETFIRRHTQFNSVDEFCTACPCDGDTIGDVQRLSTDKRDAFVARTTDFEAWTEMKQTAATEDLVTLQNV
ncbi:MULTISPECIES: hypothetical protein [unclassified Natrinema]|uniref:hypothetical protein n=1 Tax=unclassified Natrinema TaxID=2622230 RepID=UPI00026D43BA|nr:MULTISPECIES: hypothetical protein [unclassified Natrinema]AFO58946.1 hypothetical protein NJ7G_3730 [Natrinema sp. J7-2]